MSLSADYKVQKSNLLLTELKKSGNKLTISDLKLIEVYLSKINSHRPNEREVSFTQSELQEIYGVNIFFSRLKKSVDALHHLTVSVINEDNKINTAETINLFEYSKIDYDESGVQKIHLKCSESAMRYLFNIEKIGYLEYKLRNVIHLNSRYSFDLFMYLLKNKFRSTWKVNINDLISVLKCPYDDYTTINKHILKPCQKEINEKTSLKFEYTNIRRGLDRSTKEIVFDVLSWGDLPQVLMEQAQEQEEPKQIVTQAEEKPYMDIQPATDSEEPQEEIPEHIAFLCESVDNSFTTLQMKLILATISNMDIPPSQFGREVAQFDFLRKKYLQLQITEQQTTIKNRFSYFLKMIENDAETR